MLKNSCCSAGCCPITSKAAADLQHARVDHAEISEGTKRLIMWGNVRSGCSVREPAGELLVSDDGHDK